jgi:two-component system response regulator YesN
MRVVIADDEYLVRSSLKSMLEELALPLEFIGEGTTGEELVNLVRQSAPDVAFVDIRMPGLNGLEAIQIARPLSPLTRWFILTGFSEFEYAKEAIRLGVSGYLLKPVNPDELRKVFGDLLQQNRKQIVAQNLQFERELVALWYGLTPTELEESDAFFSQARFMGAIICLDSSLPEKTIAERHRALCKQLRQSIDQSLEAHNRIALFILQNGDLATIGAWEPAPDSQAEKRVREYLQAADQACRAANGPDLAATTLVSKDASYRGLQEQFDRLQKQAPLRAVTGIGRRLEISVIEDQAQKPGRLELGAAAVSLSRAFRERNSLNYAKSLGQLEKILVNAALPANRFLARSVADYLHRAMGCQVPDDPAVKPWIQALQVHGERMLKNTPREETQSPDSVNQVLAFIDQNYMREISIGQIAEQLNLTPNYLSTLFHKKTGTNFMNYLKTIRLAKARELLADPSLQIQQVAEQVGYFSARHFARLFAEQFGCLPSEYRGQIKEFTAEIAETAEQNQREKGEKTDSN